MPCHFIVCAEDYCSPGGGSGGGAEGGRFYVDCFDSFQIISAAGALGIVAQRGIAPRPEFLAPAPPVVAWRRCLRNLVALHSERKDSASLAGVLRQMLALSTSAPATTTTSTSSSSATRNGKSGGCSCTSCRTATLAVGSQPLVGCEGEACQALMSLVPLSLALGDLPLATLIALRHLQSGDEDSPWGLAIARATEGRSSGVRAFETWTPLIKARARCLSRCTAMSGRSQASLANGAGASSAAAFSGGGPTSGCGSEWASTAIWSRYGEPVDRTAAVISAPKPFMLVRTSYAAAASAALDKSGAAALAWTEDNGDDDEDETSMDTDDSAVRVPSVESCVNDFDIRHEVRGLFAGPCIMKTHIMH